MQEFDALCHAMTTIATGGFSNYDNSIAHFANVRIELTMVIFMILSSLPFVIYVHFFNGRNFSIFSDLQVKLFFILLIIVVITMTLWLYFANHVPFIYALRDSLFNMTSVMTTSGFSTARYDNWGNFAIVMIFLVSVIGGCMGSTAGGIKIFRYQILFKTATQQIDKLIHPHRVFNFYYGDRPVSTEVKSSVINFFILFAASFTFIAALLPIVDHNIDFLTSVSAAASAIANAGPALGNIAGPGGHYGSFTDPAKLLLTLGMLVGRLELFTILVLLSPKFWRG
jgi:trk system potassium uptake protein TrkH